MDREFIIDYLKRKREFDGIERDFEITVLPNKITAIVGPRRSGKTYYLLYLMNTGHGNSLYLNFENIFLRETQPREIFEIIKLYTEVFGKPPKTIMLDEVQELKNWDSIARTLLDYGYRLVLTGSSSKLLSKEIASRLRGRSLTFFLLPFSFKEYLRAKGIEITEEYLTLEKTGLILNYLREYLEYGGFPEVVLAPEKREKERIIRSYYDEILLKDFVERHAIKSMELGRFLFEYIIQNYSKELSISKVEGFLSSRVPLSRKTIYSYIEKLEDTLSVFFVDRLSKSIYKRKEWPKKGYIVDTSLSLVLAFSQDIGKKMENLVYLELLRRKNKYPFMEVFYWKDYHQHEVDFVIKEGQGIKQLLQVTYASGRDEVEKREIRSLIKASKELDCKDLLVLTWDYEGEEEREGRKIRYLPLWKWLLF